MEYVPGGDLGSWIYRRGHLPEADVKVMASQLLSALKYLHDMQITHRDVKPDNILIHSLSPFHAKLTDFGLSKMVDTEETFLRTFCGTLLYCAPEVYSEYREYDHSGRRNPRGVSKKYLPPQRYDHAVDIWSLAGVLFYSLCGSPPYPVKKGTTYQELLNHIMTQPLDIRPLQIAEVSESGIRFVRSMLHTRPEHRATIAELENASWLGGGEDSIEMSIEDDEVDLIGDGSIDPLLQDGASQLSIHDEEFRQIDDSQGDVDLNSVSDLTEIQQLEIPNSFNTDENLNGSYGFPIAPANPGNGRLFGEVNPAALGSSGAIALDHLPIQTVNHRNPPSDLGFSQDSMFTQTEPSNDSSRLGGASQLPLSAVVTMAMPPPPPPAEEKKTTNNSEADERAARSSSLMGAESLVEHLNMHSPASAVSPTAHVSTPPTTTITHDANVSLRRTRVDYEEDCIQPWGPADLPPKKRRKSEREIDIVVPPSVFWDPKDRSTHHNNYPAMSVSDLTHYQQYAEGKGEKFEHGQKTFDTTMQSFKSSRSPSLEPEAARARSEPIDGRRTMMKRDERKLAEDLVERIQVSEPQRLANRDSCMPDTARGSDEPRDISTVNTPSSGLHPVVGNDFQPPKRILAKILATSDSCLPTLSLNITDNLTSWGRGFKNTVRCTNGQEIRLPKYAFKIFLFKRGFYTSSANSPDANEEDMSFYISSKATYGIKVNGVQLPSANHQEPQTPSKYWAELRHGDVLTLWWSDLKPDKLFTKFRFECYWGKSKESRKEGETFQIFTGGLLVNEIEDACLAQEKIILAEIERREEEDRKIQVQEKQAGKNGSSRQVDVIQSFVDRPASGH
jgi:serine/threonine protein kinase